MNRTITLLTAIAIAGCPTDDVPSGDISTATGSSGDPDLPGDGDGDPSTTTESTGDGDQTGPGDGDGEPTGDGDGDPTTGDGDPTTGDGDGDGDGDTGSEAETTSLIVESDGVRIGYLMGVWDYGFIIWDDVNEVSFQLNQQTGHVVGGLSYGYFPTPDCSGQRYEQAVYVPIEMCNQTPAPTRRYVRGDNVPTGGHVAAPTLVATAGEPLLVNVQSILSGGNCVAQAVQYCMFATQTTNVIPKTFPLPITAAEAIP